MNVPTVLRDKVCVELNEVEEKSPGGLYIPDDNKESDKPICCRLLGNPRQSDKVCIRVLNANGEYINMWLSKSFLKKLEEHVYTDNNSESIQISLRRSKV